MAYRYPPVAPDAGGAPTAGADRSVFNSPPPPFMQPTPFAGAGAGAAAVMPTPNGYAPANNSGFAMPPAGGGGGFNPNAGGFNPNAGGFNPNAGAFNPNAAPMPYRPTGAPSAAAMPTPTGFYAPPNTGMPPPAGMPNLPPAGARYPPVAATPTPMPATATAAAGTPSPFGAPPPPPANRFIGAVPSTATATTTSAPPPVTATPTGFGATPSPFGAPAPSPFGAPPPNPNLNSAAGGMPKPMSFAAPPKPAAGGYAYPPPPTGAASPTAATTTAATNPFGGPPPPTGFGTAATTTTQPPNFGASALPPPPAAGTSFSAPPSGTGYAYAKPPPTNTGAAGGFGSTQPVMPPAGYASAPPPQTAQFAGYPSKPVAPSMNNGSAAAAGSHPPRPAVDPAAAYANYKFPEMFKQIESNAGNSKMPAFPPPALGGSASMPPPSGGFIGTAATTPAGAGRGYPPMPPPGGGAAGGPPVPPPQKKLYYNPEEGVYTEYNPQAQQSMSSFDGLSSNQDYNNPASHSAAGPPQSPRNQSSNQLLSTTAVGIRRPNQPPYVRPVNPAYIQMVCNAMPSSSALRLRTNIPFGLIVQPFADAPAGEPALPVVNFGTTGVIRCKHCRAYINPYVSFLNNGQIWRCNCCHRDNEVPSSYYSPTNANGLRNDLGSRPELTNSSFEITAPVEYMVRPPMPPSYLFVIDVSTNSVRNGVLKSIAESVKQTLSSLPGATRTRIGFVTFNSSVHVYQMRASSPTPTMYVLPDLEDIFLPVPGDLLVSLEECRSQVDAFLDSLPNMYSPEKDKAGEKYDDVESALGPALEASLQVMGRIGGKMLVFCSGLPSLGMGRLSNRENPRNLGTAKEHETLQAANDFYKKKAIKLTRYQIGVDLFLFANAAFAHSGVSQAAAGAAGAGAATPQPIAEFVDVATVSQLAKFTGGQTYYYPGFSYTRNHAKFSAELQRNLVRTTGWESVVRIRPSAGLKLKAFYGNFYLRGADLLALPIIDSEKAFAVEMVNDEQPIAGADICVQAALLYTTSEGERRIRVHTISLPVVASPLELFPSLSVTAAVNLMAKQAIDATLTQSFDKSREYLRNKAFGVIRAFRQSGYSSLRFTSAAEQQAAQQAVSQAQASTEVLALLTLGVLKSAAFREAVDIRSDARSSVFGEMSTMGLTELETFVRPRLLPVHDLQANVGVFDEKKDGANRAAVELPGELSLSAEQLRPEGIYLLDNGYSMFLRVGSKVAPYIVDQLIHLSSPAVNASTATAATGTAASLAPIASSNAASPFGAPAAAKPFGAPATAAGASFPDPTKRADAKSAPEKPQLMLKVPTSQDSIGRSLLWRLTNVVNALRAQSTRHAELVIYREGGDAVAEQRMYHLLIEDRGANNAMSLAEFNAHINKAIAQYS